MEGPEEEEDDEVYLEILMRMNAPLVSIVL